MLKVNEYFDGNVKSIAFDNAEGQATIGVPWPRVTTTSYQPRKSCTVFRKGDHSTAG